MRVLDLRRPFREAQPRLAPRGSAEWAAVSRVLRELMDDRVPLVGPEDISVKHGLAMMGRAVPGTDLVVYYIPAGTEVSVMNLVRLAPRL